MHHTQTSCSTWFLTCWLQTSGIYTLQIKTCTATQTRSNGHHRWWEGRLKEGLVWEAGELWKRTGWWGMAGIVSGGEKREDDVVTPAGVWRACSLRRTSRHCCHTLCPSGGLPEPCNHECPCNTQNASQSTSAISQQSHTLDPHSDGRMRGATLHFPHPPVWKPVASTVTKLLLSDTIRPHANSSSTYKMTCNLIILV